MKYNCNEIAWSDTKSFPLMECYWVHECLKLSQELSIVSFLLDRTENAMEKNKGSLMTLIVLCLTPLSSKILCCMLSTEMEHLTFFPQRHAVQDFHCT